MENNISNEPQLRLENQSGNNSRKSYDIYLKSSVLGGLILLVGLGGWASTATIEGAVLGSGQVIVESQAKTIQHQDGGIIEEILIRNGDEVEINDVLFRLNPTESRNNREIVVNRLVETRAQIARLKAERDGNATIKWPQSLLDDQADPLVADVISGQTKLFDARRRAADGQVFQLRKQKQQIQEQIIGTQSMRQARSEQVSSIEQELVKLRQLLDQGYVSASRVMAMERERSRLMGDIANDQAQIASANTQIAEIDVQIRQISRDIRAEILTELRQFETEEKDLQAQLGTLSDKLDRIDIKAPVAGTIYNLNLTTIGGVAMPGDDLVQIIPKNDELVVEAKVSPRDIDQVYRNQDSMVTLSAFNQRTTPQLHGEVTDISANSLLDEVSGQHYFQVTIEIPASEIDRLNGLRLVPGMPADVFIKTEPRTVTSYLLRPFTDTMRRAFREE